MVVAIVLSTSSATSFFALQGASPTATEVLSQIKAIETATLSFMRAVVASNAQTGTTTVVFRKSGVTGNQALSIGTAATGAFEDTTNTDSVVSGDLINGMITLGGTGLILMDMLSMLYTGSGTPSPLTTNQLSILGAG